MNQLIAKICRRLLLGQLIGLALLAIADIGYYLAYYKQHSITLRATGVVQGSEMGINLVVAWWLIGIGTLTVGLILGLIVYSAKSNRRYLVPTTITNPLESRLLAELLAMVVLGLMLYFIIIYASGFVVLLFLTSTP